MGNKSINKTEHNRPRVHKILAYSYLVYLFALFLGLIFSVVRPFKIFTNDYLMYLVNISATILLLSSALIFWAQKTTSKFNKENLTKASFKKGPYRYIRNPTNIGLFLSLLSFGIIINSVFVIFFSLIAFLFSSLFFIKKEEDLLGKKYGTAYFEYKKDVKY